MRSTLNYLFFCLTLLAFSNIQAQNDYSLNLGGERVVITENITTFDFDQFDATDRVQGGYYTWLQFYATPRQAVQDQLRANNVELQDYVGKYTYLAFVPAATATQFLQQNGVRSIMRIPGRFRMSSALRNGDIGDWAVNGSKLFVTFQHHDRFTTEDVLEALSDLRISVKQEWKGARNIDLVIPNDCLDQLSELPFVRWIEVLRAPDEKEDIDARGLHRAANLDTQTPGGRNYTGEGVGVLVRDDGIVGPHIDFTGRIDNSNAVNVGPTHGDGVSGILAGAGNLNPNNRGMAAGSDLYVVNYGSSFQDFETTSLIANGIVQITNSSYGNGCNEGYTSVTQTVDQQAITYTNLLHVFSAGNSGTSDCDFGAGSGWGVITGGHKQGKNVIATANVFSDGDLVGSSSRGPAHDGRIKPDIAANGQNQISTDEDNGYSAFGGTSGASPGIAGISAQLYQAYAEANNGEKPEGALIKATLLNTANEAGNVGPDYKFGWGIVNALRAGKLIEDNRYFTDTIAQLDTNTHVISIPAGAVQVRFMVYWRDPAAFPGANVALVNDLDMVVIDSAGMGDTLMPWILNPTPNADSLDLPAKNGADHLNNMEQVLINYPDSGDYHLQISGFDVAQGPQAYYVVYEIITDNITVTFPNDSVNLVGGETEFVHWDAVNVPGNFLVKYSNDNGATWSNIGFVSNSTRLLNWSVPNDVTGQALVRVSAGNFIDVSDENFAISREVTGLEVTSACPDDMTFSWNALAGAETYSLHILGDKYMEVRGVTDTTFITIPNIQLGDDVWYAITAHNATEGWGTRRTIAQFFNDALFNCVLNNDLLVRSINSDASNFSAACGPADSLVSVTIENNGLMFQTGFEITYQLNSEPLVTEVYEDTLFTGETIDYTFDTQLAIPVTGNYDLTLSVMATGDEYDQNNVQTVSFFVASAALATPSEETFETTGFPGNLFTVVNPDEDFGWEEITVVVGATGGSTTAGFINNFDYNQPGEPDYVQTPIYQLGMDGMLSFDIAKAQYNANLSDAFEVEISTDCGESFTSIYYKDGLSLSTLPNYTTTSSWMPSVPSQWRTEEIDLADYIDVSVMFRFTNINGYGNTTLLDNINVFSNPISGVRNQAQLEGVTVFPNPAKSQVTIGLPELGNTDLRLEVLNNVGQLVATEATSTAGRSINLDVSAFPAGIYYLRLTAGDKGVVKRLIVN